MFSTPFLCCFHMVRKMARQPLAASSLSAFSGADRAATGWFLGDRLLPAKLT